MADNEAPEGKASRQTWHAECALKEYGSVTGTHDEAQVRDILSDLMHYCADKDIDFDTELSQATDNFGHERDL